MNLKSWMFCWGIISICWGASVIPDDDQPLTVQSDSAVVNYKTGVGSYVGHVVAVEGSRHLTGDIVTLYRDPLTKQLSKVDVKGRPARYHFLPEPGQQEVYAHGDHIVFLPEQHLLILTGDAQVAQGRNIFNGPKIMYDTQTAVIHAPSQAGRRPSMVIEPVAAWKTPSKTDTIPADQHPIQKQPGTS